MSNTTNIRIFKSLLKYWYVLVVLVFISSILAYSASAQTMSNNSYMIQMGNLNSISGEPTGSGYRLSYTAGQTGPGLYSGTNYKVRAGFQYILSIIPFRFSITNNFIDFGIVSPTSPVLRTSTLTVSNGSAFGYQVTASENHNLRDNRTGYEIPQTICNAGNCTTTTAALWDNSLVYGFGYRCDNNSGTDCDSQFLPPTYTNFYRPFAASPSAVAVMSSSNVSRNRQTTITYKLNISGSQAAGLYTNVINYIAAPTF
jgi:hypothetical protein